MKSSDFWHGCLVIPLVFVLIGSKCEKADKVTGPGGPALVDSIDDKLAVGNRIMITFSGIAGAPPPHVEEIRGPDGYIHPPLLKDEETMAGMKVKAAGKTIEELQGELYKLYVPAQFLSLTLILSVDGRFYTVDGQVRLPGRFPYVGKMRVSEAIAEARGFNNFADRKRITVTRANGNRLNYNSVKAKKNAEYDLFLFPGDIVNVPKSFW